MAQNYLISNFDIGLERDLDPYLIPERAFPVLEDAVVFRGRVERRKGFSNRGRLRRVIAATVITQTTAAGLATTIADLLADATIALRASQPNGELQPGTIAVISGANTWDDTTTDGVMTATGGNAADGTINYVTGQIVLNFIAPDPGGVAISIAFNYFPSLPVMGLRTRELINLNEEQTIAFDTRYAYRFNGSAWEEFISAAATTWGGSNSQFFWTTNYRGLTADVQLFWATNYSGGAGTDPIRYHDGLTWTSFTPTVTAGVTIGRALILLPFKNRMLALYTNENGVAYPQRCRFSQNGDPRDAANSWRSDIIGRGGFVDASTSEAIVSAQFVKDRLIVFFENSTWELVYIGNAALPFVWQQINTELGAESQFSEIPFDDGVIGVGDTGIHLANSNGVQRIDQKIPDEIVKIANLNQGPSRVYGIRDYVKQLVYWSLTDFSEGGIFPNRVLVYNYINNTFAIFKDRFTCYGYFQSVTGLTWADLTDRTWATWTDPWGFGITQAFAKQIIAGNQQGFTLLFNDTTLNGSSLTLQSITTPAAPSQSTVTSFNHNLEPGMFVRFENIPTLTITPIGHSTQAFKVLTTATNTFTIDGRASGSYPGGGRIIVLNNISIATKEFDFAAPQDKSNCLKQTHFLLEKTTNGEITLDLYINSDTSTPLDPLMGNKHVNTRPETGIQFQNNQQKIWHKVSRPVIGNSFQMRISLDDTQMRTPAIQESDIVLHAIMMQVEPVGRI